MPGQGGCHDGPKSTLLLQGAIAERGVEQGPLGWGCGSQVLTPQSLMLLTAHLWEMHCSHRTLVSWSMARDSAHLPEK